MKIALKDFIVESINLSQCTDVDFEDDLTINFVNGYSEVNEKSFTVKFNITLLVSGKFNLEVVKTFEFESDEPISKEFMDSAFPVVNAPAIAYPYLRSFIGTLTLNAGLEAVMLPTVNFQAMYNASKASVKE
jgi:preprotein translocase subunit SecB